MASLLTTKLEEKVTTSTILNGLNKFSTICEVFWVFYEINSLLFRNMTTNLRWFSWSECFGTFPKGWNIFRKWVTSIEIWRQGISWWIRSLFAKFLISEWAECWKMKKTPLTLPESVNCFFLIRIFRHYALCSFLVVFSVNCQVRHFVVFFEN